MEECLELLCKYEHNASVTSEEAEYMLANLCEHAVIEKIRHRVRYAGWLWDVDEFEGANAGLVIAELELDEPELAFPSPPWLGREVTDEPSYSSLATRPYATWPATPKELHER